VQTGKPVFDKAPAPLADGGHAPAQALGDGPVALARRRPQHQLGARYQGMRQRARRGQTRQLRLLLRAQLKLGLGSSNWHRHLSLTRKDTEYASKNYAS